MNSRRGMILALCCLIGMAAFATVFIVRSGKQATPASRKDFVSQRALSALLDGQLNDYEGKPQPFSQWKEKILVINFWATWCAPCREEMPYFSRISEKFAAKGVQFVGISADAPNTVRLFAQQRGISYPLLIGGPQVIALSTELGNKQSGLPFTLILGRSRETLLTRTGRLAAVELENVLQSATTTTAPLLDKMSRTTAN